MSSGETAGDAVVSLKARHLDALLDMVDDLGSVPSAARAAAIEAAIAALNAARGVS